MAVDLRKARPAAQCPIPVGIGAQKLDTSNHIRPLREDAQQPDMIAGIPFAGPGLCEEALTPRGSPPF